MLNSQKGQIAAEYLVIFALILTIALVAIGLSIFFIQSSADVSDSEVRTYWATQVRPIRIIEMEGYTAASGPGKIAFLFENIDDKHITLQNFTIEPPSGGATFDILDSTETDIGGSADGINSGSGLQIAPGEKVVLYLTSHAFCTDDSPTGRSNSEKFYNDFTIHYDTPYFTGLSFKGVKPISGKCN